MTWNELQVRDPEAHKAFYKGVFGWTPVATDQGPIDYTMFNSGEAGVGGMLTLPPEVPANIPAALVRALRHRGRRRHAGQGQGARRQRGDAPVDIPIGRFGIATDPHGTAFAFVALKEWPQ